jgi:Galactose mutarotase and related enzymes
MVYCIYQNNHIPFTEDNKNMSISKGTFGTLPGGGEVEFYILENKSGAKIKVLTLGGIIAELWLPDRDGNLTDVVCGFDSVEGYLTGGGYQGALIGRYGNRIADGKFTLNGKTYTLAKNEGGISHLHGGDKGFNLKLWDAQPQSGSGFDSLSLTCVSPDGEEGYPGNLSVKVTYIFTDDNSFSILYEADTDADTPVNLTNHAYYNLSGFGAGDVLSQRIQIDADYYNDVDEKLIPAGAPKPVAGTAFDFTAPRAIGQGYDHNFVLRPAYETRKIAQLWDDASGRGLELCSDMPAVQLYTACMMNGAVLFKGGVPQRPLHALCLETQYSPDSPNRPDFPSCILHAGDHMRHETIFKFFTF